MGEKIKLIATIIFLILMFILTYSVWDLSRNKPCNHKSAKITSPYKLYVEKSNYVIWQNGQQISKLAKPTKERQSGGVRRSL